MRRQLSVFVLSLFALTGAFGREPFGPDDSPPAAHDSWKISMAGHAGYGFLLMKEVNRALQVTQDSLKLVGGPDADKVRGGNYFDGQIKASRGPVSVGVIVSHVNAKGSIGFGDPTGKLTHRFETRSLEVLALGTYGWRIDEGSTYDLGVAAGYGMGSCDFIYSETVYASPAENFLASGEVTKGYFAARLLANIHYHIGRVTVDLGGGYRFADAGVMKGDLNLNGRIVSDQPILDARTREVEFDFSGLYLLAGLSVTL